MSRETHIGTELHPIPRALLRLVGAACLLYAVYVAGSAINHEVQERDGQTFLVPDVNSSGYSEHAESAVFSLGGGSLGIIALRAFRKSYLA